MPEVEKQRWLVTGGRCSVSPFDQKGGITKNKFRNKNFVGKKIKTELWEGKHQSRQQNSSQ